MPPALNTLLLRGALALAGLVVVFLGLNVGLGGIVTLGWQGGDAAFLTVTDQALYAVRDNHVRFIGGVWLATGIVLLAGAVWPDRLRPVLIALTAMIAIGGLARFSAADAGLLLGPAILPSLLIELVAFPMLGYWLWRTRPVAHAQLP